MDLALGHIEVTLPGVISYTMGQIASEFAVAYNIYDGGYPPIDLWGIITGLIEIIREFFTNLIEQIKEANPFKKGWHTPLWPTESQKNIFSNLWQTELEYSLKSS